MMLSTATCRHYTMSRPDSPKAAYYMYMYMDMYMYIIYLHVLCQSRHPPVLITRRFIQTACNTLAHVHV